MLGLLLLQRCADDAGEIAHILGHEEVMLHETFDIVLAGMRRIAKALGDFRLDVEGKAFFCLQRREMHVAPHRPKKIFRLVEQLQLGS